MEFSFAEESCINEFGVERVLREISQLYLAAVVHVGAVQIAI